MKYLMFFSLTLFCLGCSIKPTVSFKPELNSPVTASIGEEFFEYNRSATSEEFWLKSRSSSSNGARYVLVYLGKDGPLAKIGIRQISLNTSDYGTALTSEEFRVNTKESMSFKFRGAEFDILEADQSSMKVVIKKGPDEYKNLGEAQKIGA